MKSIVIYTLDSCTKCMKCLKVCPTSAIRIENARVIVDDKKCINCAKCIGKCMDSGLTSKGSTVTDIANYDYTICLVPSALLHNCTSKEEIESLNYAIAQLGFDEVHDLTAFEKAADEAFTSSNEASIKTFCPVIKRLIRFQHLMLVDQLSDIDYPSEIAARYYRKHSKDKGNVGIFLLCECSSKLGISKYPYGNFEYEVDHALAICDVFPLIQMNMSRGMLKTDLQKEGFVQANIESCLNKENHLVADGLDKCLEILDMIEFDRIRGFEHYSFYQCFNGCIGGDLLWGNPYTCKNNYKTIEFNPEKVEYEDLELYSQRLHTDNEEKRTSLKERMQFFNEVTAEYEKLPGYDCGACGYPNCRSLAEAIVLKKADASRCSVLEVMDWRKNEG